MLEHDIFALIQTHFKRFHSLGLRIWLQNYRKLFTLCRRSHSFQCCTPLIHKIRACFTSSISVSLRQWLLFSHPFKLLVSSFSTSFSSSVGPVPSLCSVLLPSALFVQVSVVSPRALLWYVAHWCDTLPTPVHISAALYCFNDCHLD